MEQYLDLVEDYAIFDTDNNRKYALSFSKTDFLIYIFAKSDDDVVKDLDVLNDLGRKYSLREDGYSDFSVSTHNDGSVERDAFVFKCDREPNKQNVWIWSLLWDF